MTTPAFGEIARAFRLLGTLAERAPAAAAGVSELLDAVGRLVGNELATLSVCDLRAGRRLVSSRPQGVLTADDLARFDRLLDGHPLVRYHALHARARVRRLSDCEPDAVFRTSELLQVYYRPLGLDRVLLVPLERSRTQLTGFVLNRRGADFSDAEVRLLELLRMPLLALYRQALASSCASCSATCGERAARGPARERCALTERESEVLAWVAAGKSDACIAELLGLSPRTVSKHLQNVYRKLGVANRTGAAMRALGR